ncbi:metal-dependent transcriptional regulator [Desulfosporosinus meridiei]|uniref:Manganese transport regulator n=1 Tax=Desulfosporosinus meridiei (strain ATCC BAA-275 / DSM 13257 / KCTC 12902 / NCIMB 13706 / S10) TaxID=768704 RepID=J7ITX6_DESMD|nr:iron dependent repressor, metal binding and dimerization domain protein [Desulfosporosinus meridiei]AFQ42573.1 Mn-dependent transcriptional regulator [Desulfosporosinus meridiei DSM 13257]
MSNKTDLEFRTVRGYQLINQQEGHLTPAMEDYLEMAYRLCLQHGYTRVGTISEELHVKPSSASKMVSRLVDLGYLEYDRYESILLTKKGRERGAYLLDRHNTVAKFLQLIGCQEPLEETELIEHSVSPSTLSLLNALLAFFQSNSCILQSYEDYKKT